jgi:hypothetical protein
MLHPASSHSKHTNNNIRDAASSFQGRASQSEVWAHRVRSINPQIKCSHNRGPSPKLEVAPEGSHHRCHARRRRPAHTAAHIRLLAGKHKHHCVLARVCGLCVVSGVTEPTNASELSNEFRSRR